MEGQTVRGTCVKGAARRYCKCSKGWTGPQCMTHAGHGELHVVSFSTPPRHLSGLPNTPPTHQPINPPDPIDWEKQPGFFDTFVPPFIPAPLVLGTTLLVIVLTILVTMHVVQMRRNTLCGKSFDEQVRALRIWVRVGVRDGVRVRVRVEIGFGFGLPPPTVAHPPPTIEPLLANSHYSTTRNLVCVRNVISCHAHHACE